MASVTDPPPIQDIRDPAFPSASEVDEKILRTRRALKTVDAVAGLIAMAIGVLLYLLVASLLEHWVIPGGWNATFRTVLFSVLILGIGWYGWRIFWPLVSQPINPAYAALAIEQNSPSLKNSLLNLLLLRGRRQQMPQQVYQAIEQQAAQGLSKVSLDSVVDRSIILKLGYVLVAVVAVCTLYKILSPKDPITSAGRVLLPWSNIAVPSRVKISDITPGDTSLARGEQLAVSAEIFGLDEDELVELHYSTNDKQLVDKRIPMTSQAGGARYECNLPSRIASGGSGGIQQDTTYWIEAGDARSVDFTITVFSRPTLVVNKLRYSYPAYTGLPPQEVEFAGDIQGIEGTKVTISAQANKPIRQAHVDFEADGKLDLLMKASEQEASVTFPLKLKDDRRTPWHQSYTLRYVTEEGRKNQLPPKYQIDVIPDYAPEIQLLLPEEAMRDVKLDEPLRFELEARDPDYALRSVILQGKVEGERALNAKLLTTNHQGKFQGQITKTPAEMGLRVGDVLEYWGTAVDNREPVPNVSHSVRRKIRVVDPSSQDGGQGQENGQPGENGTDQSEGAGGQGGEGQQDQQGPGGAGDQGDSNQENSGEGGEGQGGAGQNGQGEQSDTGDQQGDSGGDQQNGAGQQDGENDAPGENQSGNGNNSASESNNPGDRPSDPTPGENPGNSPGENGQRQEKVSAEGDDDGTAFERIADHFNEQEGNNQGGGSQNANQQNEGASSDNQPGNENSHNNQGNKASDGANQGEQNAGEKQESDLNNDGQSAEDRQAFDEGNGQEQPGNESPDTEATPQQGEEGAGDNQGEDHGVPNESDPKTPRDKQGDQPGDRQESQEPSAESKGQTESDSAGAESGDRSGGGQEGAGQQADADGKGTEGQNQAADEGAGQSNEQGEGDAGSEAGDQQSADGKTGESSENQSGDGSQTGNPQQGQEGNQQGSPENSSDQQSPNQEGANQQGQQGNQQSPNQQQGNQASDQQSPEQQNESNQQEASQDQNNQQQNNNQQSSGQAGSSSPDQAGTGGGNNTPPPSTSEEMDRADKANLDYAEKQTDLILDRLEDQLKKKSVDKNLLEKLGWNEQELRRFVDRWKNLKAEAENAANPEAKSELDNMLRSLGLSPKKRYGYQSRIDKDKLRDLQDSYRGKAPLEYQEQLRAYIKGTSSPDK